ncbi:hypothetical protein AMTR_s00088p00037190 [Amborella trichopoda]|uniref:MULE transposase domain-containing protein n=1 Tax=Amborella trichopoda TaxID=13333 RepID=W1NVY8_AMBTC|nr:hypothetical protein AMTR_s00088p00037190 [Amborella trichopoda]
MVASNIILCVANQPSQPNPAEHQPFVHASAPSTRDSYPSVQVNVPTSSNTDAMQGSKPEGQLVMERDVDDTMPLELPFISTRLDGMFLKGTYLGILLAAIATDVNGGTFPIVIAVVENAHTKSWIRFLDRLNWAFLQEVRNLPRLTIFYDRHKGLQTAIKIVFPGWYPGHCMRHLVNTFKRKWRSKVLLKKWWKVAHALSTEGLEEDMLKIKEIDKVAYIRMKTKEEHEMPLIPLCKNLRIKLVKRWAERQQEDRKYEIHKEMAHAVDLDVEPVLVVWENNGLPCTHAIAAMYHCHLHPIQFCEMYFRDQAYKTTHAIEFYPVPNSMPLTGAFNRTVYPPNAKRCPGRPMKRRRQTEEKSTRGYVCKRCG